jgi:hypothetical protein
VAATTCTDVTFFVLVDELPEPVVPLATTHSPARMAAREPVTSRVKVVFAVQVTAV